MSKIERFLEFKNPDGWVNIKIDSQVYIRMARYVNALDDILEKQPIFKKSDKYDLFKKIDILSNVEALMEDKTPNISIQLKLSVITLLQYLKEIENNFNASSAGFLLEGFLASLIHGKLDDNAYGSVDISTSYSELNAPTFKTEGGLRGVKKINYQIKLYNKKSTIKLRLSSNDTKIDYYVICLKLGGVIDVHILPEEELRKYAQIEIKTGGHIRTTNSGELYININTSKLVANKFKKSLNIGNLDILINKCGDKLKESIEKVYNLLSELHYDIDSLISGRDKDKEIIAIDIAAANAESTVERIGTELIELKGRF